MFNKKYKEKIMELEEKNLELKKSLEVGKSEAMVELMRESLGMEIDFSAASTDKCMPPYYLDGLEEDERKNFVIDMETVYNNEKFQKVVKYMINLFALNAVYKYDERERQNNQAAVVAFRTFLKQFNDMHKEFLSYKPPDKDFDPLAPLPE